MCKEVSIVAKGTGFSKDIQATVRRGADTIQGTIGDNVTPTALEALFDLSTASIGTWCFTLDSASGQGAEHDFEVTLFPAIELTSPPEDVNLSGAVQLAWKPCFPDAMPENWWYDVNVCGIREPVPPIWVGDWTTDTTYELREQALKDASSFAWYVQLVRAPAKGAKKELREYLSEEPEAPWRFQWSRPVQDSDGDGWPDDVDCLPNDPLCYPGAFDAPWDGVDCDCDGRDPCP